MPAQVDLGCTVGMPLKVLIARPSKSGRNRGAERRLLRELENDQSTFHDEAQLGEGEKGKWKASFPYQKTLADV